MAKKEGLIQVRTTVEEKEKIQSKADKLNLSVSNYVLKCISDKDNIINIFEQFNSKFEDIKEKIDYSFSYLKEDTEAIKNKEKEGVVKEYISINLEKNNLSLFKVDDILEANNNLYIVENILSDGLGIKNLLNLKTSKLTQEHTNSITSVRRKVEV
jgi:NMD protein affecting ribosome stability and mRNA decay